MSGLRIVAALALVLGLAAALPAARAEAAPHAANAAALHARFAALQDRLASNPFQRPLVLESAQSAGDLKGDVYALVDQRYAAVAPALRSADQWCDILILHLNVKGCQASAAPQPMLTLDRRQEVRPADRRHLPDRVRVPRRCAGPGLSAGAAARRQRPARHPRLPHPARGGADRRQDSFIHMSYSYGYGLAARMAMQAYLATVGRDKVGFSVARHQPDGEPVYVGGVLGLVERNTMRYYLAIESYLDAARLPAPQQLERRLLDWHAGTDRYARQLHEIDQADYLAMKRREIARQGRGPA